MSEQPSLRVAYADPPYPGCAHLYADHPDYAGEVDHKELAERLLDEFDGFCLHTNSTTLRDVWNFFGTAPGLRVMAWVKPFAAFKRNVSVALRLGARHRQARPANRSGTSSRRTGIAAASKT